MKLNINLIVPIVPVRIVHKEQYLFEFDLQSWMD